MPSVNITTTPSKAFEIPQGAWGYRVNNVSDETIYTLENAPVTTSTGIPLAAGAERSVCFAEKAQNAMSLQAVHGGTGNKALRYEILTVQVQAITRTAAAGASFATITGAPGDNAALAAALASAGGADVQVYTADATWTNPSPATPRAVKVRIIAGGGGGGSGAAYAAAAAGGGSGGGPGGVREFETLTTLLPATMAVVVGAGGAGGAAVTEADGNDGAPGGNSSFGVAVAPGGNKGNKGTTAGGGAACGIKSGAHMIIGMTAPANAPNGTAGGTATIGTSPTAAATNWPTPGGSGAGVGAGGASAQGGDGGTALNNTNTVTGGAGGSSSSLQPHHGANGNSWPAFGTGGGGGGVYTPDGSPSGNGGNGGGNGSGGGGGAGGHTVPGSTGGNGADGIVIVITY